MVIYITASDGNYKTNPSFDTLLALTTIGNLGELTNSCSTLDNLQSNVSLFCSYGTLSEIDELGTIDNENSDSSCEDDGAYLEVNSS